mmetsp:Transcript_63098/g.113560  ORF Transcript_63098/g.113560 Transcript_63098/m.113560 type:complete len:89 (+) Transcript_63098:2-268(+)
MRHLEAAAIASSRGKAAPPSLENAHAMLDRACPSNSGNRGTEAAYIASSNVLSVKARRANAHAMVDNACGANSPIFGTAPDERAASRG